MFRVIVCIAAAAAALAISGTAQAVTISTDTVLPNSVGQQPEPTSQSADAVVNVNVTDSIAGKYRDPFEGTALAGSPFVSFRQGSITYAYEEDSGVFSMIWGSPDADNVLELFDDDDRVFTTSGGDVALLGTPGAVAGLGFLNVAISNVTFDTAVLSTGDSHFDHANVTPTAMPPTPAAVPLPAAGWMLLAGFRGLAGMRRKAGSRETVPGPAARPTVAKPQANRKSASVIWSTDRAARRMRSVSSSVR
jgi:hypothetical protein